MGEAGPRRALAVVLLALLGLGSSTPPEPVVKAPAAESMTAQDLGGATHPHPSTWRRVLDENFAGSAVDPHRWGRCHWWARGGCTIASNDELEWYRPENVGVQGGVLRLEARAGEYTNTEGETFPYTSGMVST